MVHVTPIQNDNTFEPRHHFFNLVVQYDLCDPKCSLCTWYALKSPEAVRVAQWLEHRAQRSDDPCVRGLNPTVGRGCRSFG
jgi:hypothetical protein